LIRMSMPPRIERPSIIPESEQKTPPAWY
jgi:hypothetical protein